MKRFISIYMLIVAVVMNSCNDFLDINKNPNQATTSTPELVLAAALNTTAARTFHNQMGAMWAGQWCPSGDVSGFVQEKTYDFNNTYGTGIWTGIYDNIKDYKFILDESEKVGKKGLASVARIMMAFNYHILVDTYNNVPYSDAMKGLDVIRPSYDNGSAIYDALIADLTKAADDLKGITDANDVLGSGDIIFAGKYDMWIRFANTLKLRLLLRLSETGRDQFIKDEILKIKPAVGTDVTTKYLTADVNSNPGYLKNLAKQNQFWDNYYRDENDNLRSTYNFIRSTRFVYDNTSGDIRRQKIMGPSGSSDINSTSTTRVGVIYGDETSNAYSNASSGIGFGILKSYSMPMTIFTASESYFLQAEAVLRGYTTSSVVVGDLYVQGVKASYRLLGLPDSDSDANFDAFITSSTGEWDGTLTRLITQKWVASIGYGGFEAWCDYRRTGIPAVPLSLKAVKSSIPVRLYYPNQELQTNAENVAKQGTIDAITSKVFWDVD